jgi:hypothetical protein
MVGDEEIEETVERFSGDLDRVTKSLVSAANRGGGEDNITVIAFAVTGEGEDTAQMPAVEAGPDDDTAEYVVPSPTVDTMVVPAEQVEQVFVEAGSPEARELTRREPMSPAGRVRLVLTMLILLAIAAVLLIVGLTR